MVRVRWWEQRGGEGGGAAAPTTIVKASLQTKREQPRLGGH